MKFQKIILIPLLIVLVGCQHTKRRTTPASDDEKISKYGIFLGAESNSLEKLKQYENVAIEIENFSSSQIQELKDNKTNIYSYLSVGSLENYRSYYEEFKNLTFMDYENWPFERWVDVSNLSWQEHLVNEATRFKSLGTSGLFLDNFDVYYIANEEYQGSDINPEEIYQGCRSILSKLSNLDLKIMINSGTDFLERMSEENDPLLNKIDVYAQETVFSYIADYENDVFARQNKEDRLYYLFIISLMKDYSDILLIEYTKDEELKTEVINFCSNNGFYYYISESVNLN